MLSDVDQNHLQTRLSTLDVLGHRKKILAIQATLRERAARRQHRLTRRAKTHHIYSSRTKLDPPHTRASPDESTTRPKRAS